MPVTSLGGRYWLVATGRPSQLAVATLQLGLGNNLIETTSYNDRLQPTQIQAGSLLTLAFSYGGTANNGNVLSQTLTAPKTAGGTLSLVQNYGYDNVNRLASVAEGSWNRTYSYDAWGNRAARGADVFVDTPKCAKANDPGCTASDFQTNNRLKASWADYDAAGNLTHFKFPGNAAFDWTAGYDGENKQRYFCANQTASCGAANATAAYRYDGQGHLRRVWRVEKTSGGDSEGTPTPGDSSIITCGSGSTGTFCSGS